MRSSFLRNSIRMVMPRLALATAIVAVCCFGASPSTAAAAPDEKLAADLQRAESAWRQITGRATSPILLADAETRYAEATEVILDKINAAGWNWQSTDASVRAGNYLLSLAAPAHTAGAWKTGAFDRVETIHHPHRNRAVPSGNRAGLGLPVLAIHDATPERLQREPGLPKRGFFLPATAVLDFSPAPASDGAVHRVKLTILDPRLATRRRNRLPVAADFSTPVDREVGTQVFGNLPLLGFFRPQRALAYSGLYTFGPFDPDKIPVVFIHGLYSDPSIWANATTDLIADPELGKRCQFWYYFYPTGVPAIASAQRLREALDQLRAAYDPAGTNPNLNKLILAGHSMGGLLAHLLVIDSGNDFYDAYFAVPLAKLPTSAATKASIQRNLFFSARGDVDEAIFICTPHRGSSIADWGIARFLAKLISIPKDILQVSTQILTLNVEVLNPALRERGLPGFSVIDSLSPKNPYFRAIERQPIQRPFYSIIGDRGRDDTPHSSDGVVGYASSHWDSARGEQIVPFGHSCTNQPAVFEAIHQLIRQEVVGKKTGTSTARQDVTTR